MSTRIFFLLAALVAAARASIMLRAADGSFVPWDLMARNDADGGVAVRLKNINDTLYLATVLMGSPQQSILMSPSLAQDFIAVASPPPNATNNASFFNPGASTTFIGRNETVIQTPFGQNFTGRLASEICALNSTKENFSYNASIVLMNSSVTNEFFPTGSMGILGLGVNLWRSSTPNASLIASYLPSNFTNAVFGIELNHFDDPVPDGILTLGAVDPTAFTGNFSNFWVPSGTRNSWSIPFDGLTGVANGTAKNDSGLLASIDLMNPGIQVSTDLARQLYASVPGSQAVSADIWTLPCNSSFPLTLSFKGHQSFTMCERDSIIRAGDGTCFGAVVGGAQGIVRVGAPFLRSVYTQFGAQKAANGTISFFVGFAAKKLRQG